MPKFKVFGLERTTYTAIIEASSSSEAWSKAHDMEDVDWELEDMEDIEVQDHVEEVSED